MVSTNSTPLGRRRPSACAVGMLQDICERKVRARTLALCRAPQMARRSDRQNRHGRHRATRALKPCSHPVHGIPVPASPRAPCIGAPLPPKRGIVLSEHADGEDRGATTGPEGSIGNASTRRIFRYHRIGRGATMDRRGGIQRGLDDDPYHSDPVKDPSAFAVGMRRDIS